MNTRKLIRLATALRFVGEIAAERYGRRLGGSSVRVRRHWQGRLTWTKRHPVLAIGAGLAVGTVAFVVLGLVFALLGSVIKLALIAALGYWAFRKLQPHFKRTPAVVIVPPGQGRRRPSAASNRWP
ncbi:hypothetical protein J7643_09920 [bacterium]|nr:hypothetical protein [bacterium]